MGTGRSGSTVLEIVLASDQNIFGAGELFATIRDGMNENRDCACGLTFAECKIWSKVAKRLKQDPENGFVNDEMFRQIEWHKKFPFLLLNHIGFGLIKKHAEFNRLLLLTLSSVTGARVIIDSSKYAGRALLLYRAFPDFVKVIWLVRDPGDILASFRKPNKGEQPPKRTWSAAVYIMYVTLCAELVRLLLGEDCLVVSYEKFIENTVCELEKIELFAKLDLSKAKSIASVKGNYEVGHIVTGNRLRKKKNLQINKQASEKRVGLVMLLATSLVQTWYRVLGITKNI
jgi:hypothetical protein